MNYHLVADPLLTDVLAQIGFGTDEAQSRARSVLVQIGLTNGRNARIARTKVDAVEAALRERLVLVCSRTSCGATAQALSKELIAAAQARHCEVCGGSPNRSAIDRMVTALTSNGLECLVVVGGSPATHVELAVLVRTRIELRLISGTQRRTSRSARGDLDWADVVVIWGGTELNHQVSKLYTDGKAPHVITCPRRGIAAVADTVVRHLASRSAR